MTQEAHEQTGNDELTLEEAFALHAGDAAPAPDDGAHATDDDGAHDDIPAEAATATPPQGTPAAPSDQPDDVESLRQQLQDAQQKLQREQGRTSSLNRKLKEARDAAKQGIDALPAVDAHAPALDDAALNEMAEVFPAGAQALKALQGQVAQMQALIAAQQTALKGVGQVQEIEVARSAEAAAAAAYAQIDAAVPGWREDVATDAFKAWLGNQPPVMQACIESDDPADAVFLLTQYRAVQAPATQQVQDIRAQRQATLQQATAPRTAPAPQRKSATEFASVEDAFNYWASQA